MDSAHLEVFPHEICLVLFGPAGGGDLVEARSGVGPVLRDHDGLVVLGLPGAKVGRQLSVDVVNLPRVHVPAEIPKKKWKV